MENRGPQKVSWCGTRSPQHHRLSVIATLDNSPSTVADVLYVMPMRALSAVSERLGLAVLHHGGMPADKYRPAAGTTG